MDRVRDFFDQYKAFVGLVGGAVLGLILGLLIGWVFWPVEWTSSTPANLHPKYQEDYVVWVAENYQARGGIEWAEDKLGTAYWNEGQLSDTLERLAVERGGDTAAQLRALNVELDAGGAASAAAPTRQRLSPLLMVCGVGLLVAAVVGGTLLLVSRLRAGEGAGSSEMARVMGEEFVPTERDWGGAGPPQAQFVTTYTLGDDHYDPSFSIELETGEFMGECGVGISETLGVGDPSKVTAFEVWLFDKNDIRTVTKVLMSDYAFNDDALYAKLAPKGEPVLAQVGEEIELETKRLRLRGRILDAEYSAGDLPPSSFFDKLTVELAAWVKPEQEITRPMSEGDISFA
jgi:hypothetical protein